MSLNWNVEAVKDWKEMQEDDNERVITEAIVFGTMLTDIGKITEDNWREAYARHNTMEQLVGAYMHKDGKPFYLLPEHFHRRIGLHTNAINRTRLQWLKERVNTQVDQTKQWAKPREEAQ